MRTTTRKGDAPANDPEAGVIMELWRFFRRNPVKIAAATAVGILVGVALTLPQDRIYQAAATLEIQEINGNFMNFKDAFPVSDGTSFARANRYPNPIADPHQRHPGWPRAR